MNARTNVIATATKVLEGLRSNAPMTDSVREAMPRLSAWLRELDAPDLAQSIDEAMAQR